MRISDWSSDVCSSDLDELWAAVEAQLAKFSTKKPRDAHRPAKLLSKLCRCGVCGNSYTIVRKDRWGCRGFRQGGPSVCANNRTIDNADLERRTINGLTEQLLDSELVSRSEEHTSELQSLMRN